MIKITYTLELILSVVLSLTLCPALAHFSVTFLLLISPKCPLTADHLLTIAAAAIPFYIPWQHTCTQLNLQTRWPVLALQIIVYLLEPLGLPNTYFSELALNIFFFADVLFQRTKICKSFLILKFLRLNFGVKALNSICIVKATGSNYQSLWEGVMK